MPPPGGEIDLDATYVLGDDTPKAWSMEQDEASLRLDRGLNRVVFRLDSLGGGLGFSVLIAEPQ